MATRRFLLGVAFLRAAVAHGGFDHFGEDEGSLQRPDTLSESCVQVQVKPGGGVHTMDSDVMLVEALAGGAAMHRGKLGINASVQAPVVKDCGAVTTIGDNAGSMLDGALICPSECQYAAPTSWSACSFQCLTAADCGKGDPFATVPDHKSRVCRRCIVAGCAECQKTKDDICAVCKAGYVLNDGGCSSIFVRVWIGIAIPVVLVILFLLAWYVHLVCSPVVNEAGIQEGSTFRERTTLTMPIESAGSSATIFPVTTNLTKTPAGGPGMLLHANFQVAILLWAAVVLAAWMLFVFAVDLEYLTLGTRAWDDAISLCAVTYYGFHKQHALIASKTVFIFGVYLFSTIGALALGTRSRRMYLKLDQDMTTSHNYTAFLTGLPVFSGDSRAEEDLMRFVEALTNEKVEGVTVFWEFEDKAEEVNAAAESMLDIRDRIYLEYCPLKDQELPADFQPKGGVFGAVDAWLGFDDNITQLGETVFDKAKVAEMVRGISSSRTAAVVFETEAAKLQAKQIFDERKPELEGCTVGMEFSRVEPEGVVFEYFRKEPVNFPWRVFMGSLGVGFVVFVWVTCVLLPFADVQVEAGGEVSKFFTVGFMVLVVLGNQILYAICDLVAEMTKFTVKTNKQAFYTVLYFFAVVSTICSDLFVVVMLERIDLISKGARTWRGIPIENVTAYSELFDSYPIQKALGHGLAAYCLPATFILSFIFEPIGLMFLPKHIFTLLVGRHPYIRGRAAEKSLAFLVPLDLGRYADILVNATLAVLVFYVPPAQTVPILVGLLAGHIWIACYDHYRILRGVESFHFSTNTVDNLSQRLLAVPCALLLVCFLLKMNCNLDDAAGNKRLFCVGEEHIWKVLCVAFFLHIAIHLLLLDFVLPKLFSTKPTGKASGRPCYDEFASKTPATWFSVNPVHCLRSIAIFEHQPPCFPFLRGKEHLLVANPETGCHFQSLQFTELRPEVVPASTVPPLEALRVGDIQQCASS